MVQIFADNLFLASFIWLLFERHLPFSFSQNINIFFQCLLSVKTDEAWYPFQSTRFCSFPIWKKFLGGFALNTHKRCNQDKIREDHGDQNSSNSKRPIFRTQEPVRSFTAVFGRWFWPKATSLAIFQSLHKQKLLAGIILGNFFHTTLITKFNTADTKGKELLRKTPNWWRNLAARKKLFSLKYQSFWRWNVSKTRASQGKLEFQQVLDYLLTHFIFNKFNTWPSFLLIEEEINERLRDLPQNLHT